MLAKNSTIISAVALAAVLAGVGLVAIDREQDSRAVLLPTQAMKLFAQPKPLTDFMLTDHNDRNFDLDSLKGKWSLLFFGFTHCPDICPTTMAVLARTHEKIAKDTFGAEHTRFFFITVDPSRDTTARLKQYVGYFDSSIVGVTGSDVQIANLAAQLDAEYQVAFTPSVENYPVYHTPAVFLVDPQARYHAMFAPPFDAEAISRRLKVLQELNGGKAA